MRIDVEDARMRILLELVFFEVFEDVLHHDVGNVRLRKVGPVQAVQAISAEDSALQVGPIAVATVNKHAVVLANYMGP